MFKYSDIYRLFLLFNYFISWNYLSSTKSYILQMCVLHRQTNLFERERKRNLQKYYCKYDPLLTFQYFKNLQTLRDIQIKIFNNSYTQNWPIQFLWIKLSSVFFSCGFYSVTTKIEKYLKRRKKKEVWSQY